MVWGDLLCSKPLGSAALGKTNGCPLEVDVGQGIENAAAPSVARFILPGVMCVDVPVVSMMWSGFRHVEICKAHARQDR
ncbi:hypothetical protein [Ahrensia sp. R2A130]|uniref:hypothetical protein n=1 Tax=Ahrensia sp. R2A130 TaxID=744979 RepID=UPI0001E0E86F|nr:hypothetical protein [Ahrensia sp. R2A130]EFL90405.1 heavy metal translocating P-type ATPase [Ahrensia sp. R2A130]